jgi:hypothetical protein
MKCLQQNYAITNTFDLNVIYFNVEDKKNIFKNYKLEAPNNPHVIRQAIIKKVVNTCYILIGIDAQL